MKKPIVFEIVIFAILLAGCEKKHVSDKEVTPYHGQTFTKTSDDDFIVQQQKVADNSQVIAYASADTNLLPSITVTVAEIWKGAYDARKLGITNGTQFSVNGNSLLGPLLDGVILFIPVTDIPTDALAKRQVTFIRSGRILDLTIKEYKARLGL
jgi:hypothetical protein